MTGPPPPFPPSFTTPLTIPHTGTSNDNTNSDTNDESPNLHELILGQVASLSELIKKHNAQGENALRPIRLDFGEGENPTRTGEKIVVGGEDLKKPFKEVA